MGFSDIPAETKVWFNGKLVEWKDATVHVMTHSLHYGTAQFEGIRCYSTPAGSSVFRLAEHAQRLVNSCKLYRIPLPYNPEEISAAILQTVRANGHKACYIRPVAFWGTGEFGVNPLNNSVEMAICTWEWGKYLGEDALEKGVSVQISTWRRFSSSSTPALAKCAANYAGGQLIKMEAILNGYDEGIALDDAGNVCEGSGENIFVVKDGVVYTPPVANSILPGITRASVIRLLIDAGYQVREESFSRDFLCLADEVFFTGTAAEITPVTRIDKIPVTDGKRGPITKQMQETFFNIIDGKAQDKYNWLTSVY